MGSGVFRKNEKYIDLRNELRTSLQSVWPSCFTADECFRVTENTKDLDKLLLVSYRLMKYIRIFLKKKKLEFTEGHKYKQLFTALEEASTFYLSDEEDTLLSIEAAMLEGLSRACFNYLKAFQKIDLKFQNRWCQSCKEPISAPNELCNKCENGEDVEPFSAVSKDFPLPGGDMMVSNFSRNA